MDVSPEGTSKFQTARFVKLESSRTVGIKNLAHNVQQAITEETPSLQIRRVVPRYLLAKNVPAGNLVTMKMLPETMAAVQSTS